MTKEELYQVIEKLPLNKRRRAISVKPDYLKIVIGLYPNVESQEAVYRFVHRLSDAPSCKLCGNPTKFNKKFYPETCSYSCSAHLKKKNGVERIALEKTRNTLMVRYGVENAAHLSSTHEKRHNTLIERYGSLVTENHISKNPNTWKVLQEKGKETLMERYGVTNASQLPDYVEKRTNTMMERYGVDHFTKMVDYRKRSDENRLAKLQESVPESIEILGLGEPDRTDGEVLTRYIFKCDCGNNEELASETFKYRLRKTGTPCKKCSGLTTSNSLLETQVYNFLKTHVEDLQQSNRTIIKPYELDMVSEEHKIAIEFCGLFWHSDGILDKNYHLEKLQRTNLAGYRLITIFEDEWEHRREIVQNRLLNAFGLSGNSIGARKCTVSSVDTKTARAFIEENHIQGYANSSVKLGLYHNGNLVSVMTFSKPSLSKGSGNISGNVWEISRFCSRGNVLGGASKLFSHFIKIHSPDSVFSYADLRWGTGKVYMNMGFTFSHNSPPNYWYIQGSKRIHRFLLRKNENDDQSLTEWENRKKQGYRRIWDCGHAKWVWEKE